MLRPLGVCVSPLEVWVPAAEHAVSRPPRADRHASLVYPELVASPDGLPVDVPEDLDSLKIAEFLGEKMGGWCRDQGPVKGLSTVWSGGPPTPGTVR